MKPYFQEGGATLYNADAREVLRALGEGSVNCCVTSPPYFGLRDYGVAGQIGLERAYPEYINALVEVFREVRRVLCSDGTPWLNIGDCYATGAGNVGECPGGGRDGERWKGMGPQTPANRLPQPGLKPKDLMMIPARLALALQADGWYLRSDCIWHKPNPKPESITDRPTKAHEYLFLLTKSERYYYDFEAIKEPAADTGRINGRDGREEESAARPPGASPNTLKRLDYSQKGRNKRSVWTIATDHYPDAHSATFPPALVTPCIKAGCPVGAMVLDPFSGSGTVAKVARQLGRNFVGADLNPDFCALVAKRLSQPVLEFA